MQVLSKPSKPLTVPPISSSTTFSLTSSATQISVFLQHSKLVPTFGTIHLLFPPLQRQSLDICTANTSFPSWLKGYLLRASIWPPQLKQFCFPPQPHFTFNHTALCHQLHSTSQHPGGIISSKYQFTCLLSLSPTDSELIRCQTDLKYFSTTVSPASGIAPDS